MRLAEQEQFRSDWRTLCRDKLSLQPSSNCRDSCTQRYVACAISRRRRWLLSIVGCDQTVGELSPEANDLRFRQRPFLQFVAQRAPWNQLHGQEINSILVAEFKNGFDVRVLQV